MLYRQVDQFIPTVVFEGAIGADGIPNSIQTLANDEGVNYVLSDSDSDGTIDALELDLDDDSCNDVLDVGFADSDLDGILSSSPVTYDSNRLVASGTDGYTVPADNNSNATYNFQEAGTAPPITVQPVSIAICPRCNGLFSVTASNTDGYQW